MGHHMFTGNHIILCCATLQRKVVRRSNAPIKMGESVSGIAGVRIATNSSDDVSRNVDCNQSLGHCNGSNASRSTTTAYQERTTEIVSRRSGHTDV